MSDRSELALQLTDAVVAAYHAIERSGNRAYKSFGLSKRAHAVMAAVDLGGPDGARPGDQAAGRGVSRGQRTRYAPGGSRRGGASRRIPTPTTTGWYESPSPGTDWKCCCA